MRTYSDEQIIQFIQHAPPTVREAIESVDMAHTVMMIGQAHELRIDQIGTLAELNRNMLLGLIDPKEFLEGLHDAHVPDGDARAMIAALNTQIFVPLHQKVKDAALAGSSQGTASPSRVVAPAVPVTPAATPVASAPKVTVPSRPGGALRRSVPASGRIDHEPLPRGNETRPDRLLSQQEILSVPKPSTPVPAAAPGVPVPPPVPAAAPAAEATPRTHIPNPMAGESAPGMLPGSMPQVRVPEPSAPAPAPVPLVPPKPSVSAVSPTAQPSVPAYAPPVASTPAPAVPVAPAPAPAPQAGNPASSPSAYAADPYREPIDDEA